MLQSPCAGACASRAKVCANRALIAHQRAAAPTLVAAQTRVRLGILARRTTAARRLLLLFHGD